METRSIIKVLEQLNYKPYVIRGVIENQVDYESNIFYQKDGEEILVSSELSYNDFLNYYSSINSNIELEKLREERDIKLKQTDWTAGDDVPQSIKDIYRPYRQELRDITQKYNSLTEVVWPEKPGL